MRTTTEMRDASHENAHNPPHPGEVLKALCLEPLKLTVTAAAQALGVSRKTLSGILNGRAGITPERALRLSLAFDTSAESWLVQQLQFDLWQAERKRPALRVKRLSVLLSQQVASGPTKNVGTAVGQSPFSGWGASRSPARAAECRSSERNTRMQA